MVGKHISIDVIPVDAITAALLTIDIFCVGIYKFY